MEKPIRREPRKNKKSLNAKQLTFLAGCVIGAAALICVACFLLFSPKPEDEPDLPAQTTQATEPEKPLGALSIEDIYRQGSSMLVKTSYLDLEFPYAFSDVIFVEAVNENGVAALKFSTKTATMDEPLYTIWFGGTVGEAIGTYAGKFPVTVEFFSLPKNLSEDDQGTFKATQETFNDVLQSMHENENFA